MPARFDDTPIPGLPNTIHYIDLTRTTPGELASIASEKVGCDVRENYLPPVLDRLYERLGIQNDEKAKSLAQSIASAFFQALCRMSSAERDAVLNLIRSGCPHDLPANVHINTDLLRRLTGQSVPRLKRVLGGIRSLGFECSVRRSTEEESLVEGELLGDSYMFELSWLDFSNMSDFPALLVADQMVLGATEGYCEEHGRAFLIRLDFSQLATATASKESHGDETG